MRKLIDLSKLFHKLPVGIIKSDSEGNLSAASSEDIGALLSTLMAYSVANQRTGTAIKVWVGTEVQYQAIPIPDPDTLYFRS